MTKKHGVKNLADYEFKTYKIGGVQLEAGFYSTDELRGALDEAMWHVKYKEVKAVNEELLEALRWIATVNAMDYEYQQKAIRAAIAKAGGEA